MLGVNTMPADALASKVARASAGMILAVKYTHVLLVQSFFHLLVSSQIQDMVSFVIFKTI